MLPDPQAFARQLLNISGQEHPPTDVRRIVARWDSLSVVETELDGDGFFVDLGEIGGEIFVRKDKTEARKRFTLAHELGHFLLRVHLKQGNRKDEVEKWCNRFASELLLPEFLLSHYLKSGGINDLMRKIEGGPKTFQVSERAFFLRLSSLFPMSIFKAQLLEARLSVFDEFRSRELDEHLGTADSPIVDAEIESFIRELARRKPSGQQHLRKTDRTWLVTRIRRGYHEQQFLLLVMKR